jgi:hypothetical protein
VQLALLVHKAFKETWVQLAHPVARKVHKAFKETWVQLAHRVFKEL